MGRIIGIDLGTTTSEMAYIENGKPKMIIDNMGKRIIPSVVGLDENGEIVFGEVAYNQLTSRDEVTASEVKREIGNNIKIKLGEKEFLPHEISALLLSKLKKEAESYFGEPVEEAVITIPASFTSEQRNLTKTAGEMAGFKVDRIINEPTAAAMAYGINNLEKDEKVLVYDIGGGTFDVTILEMFDGILDVKCSRGIEKLGGKDFDERIEGYIKEEFKKQYNTEVYHCYDPKDNEEKSTLKSRIKEACVLAKIELSLKLSTNISIPFFTMIDGNPINIDIKLSREKFNEITQDLVLSTMKKIDEALEKASYTENDIDVVLLVGGSSRISAIQDLVNRKFNGKVKAGINPDEAVALGAAVQAGIKNDEISSEDSLIVTDKCSYNLGTSVVSNIGGRVVDGVFDCLIPIDSSIPCSKKKNYYTMRDNQTEVNVDVYEGNAPLVYENRKIGDFILEGIPEGKAGDESIEIEFRYDLNGILQVKAMVVSTGKYIEKIYDNSQISSSLTDNFIDELVNEESNLENWINCRLADRVKSIINIAEKKVKNLGEKEANKIQGVIEELKKAVIDSNEELVEQYDEELTDMLFEV